MKQVHGQASSEFLVLLMVFVPLVLGMVLVANMLHVQTTAHKAARYMAWESTAYDPQTYKNQLDQGVITDDITCRFLVSSGVGFGPGSVGSSREWKDPANKKDIVDLENGAKRELPRGFDLDQRELAGFMGDNNQDLLWFAQRTNYRLNTENIGYLSIPYAAENISLFDDVTIIDPKVRASFALVSDSWSAASEAQFTDVVKEVRSPNVVSAHRIHQRGFASFTRWFFDELDNNLEVGDDPYEMVSDQQSQILPASLPAYVEDADTP